MHGNKKWLLGVVAAAGTFAVFGRTAADAAPQVRQRVAQSAPAGALRGLSLDRLLDMADAALGLNLTDRQRARLQPVLVATAREANAVYENAALTPAQKRSHWWRIAGAVQTQGSSILTHEQQVTLRALGTQARAMLAQGFSLNNARD